MSECRFQLLSRAGCHLCDEMEELLAEVLPLHGEAFVVADVDSRPEWRRRYGEVTPVLLREGSPVAKIRLENLVPGRGEALDRVALRWVVDAALE